MEPSTEECTSYLWNWAEGLGEGEEEEREFGAIYQLTLLDSRQSTADIKVLSCQSCFTAYSKEKVGESGKWEGMRRGLAH